jgi:hypothetical protein
VARTGNCPPPGRTAEWDDSHEGNRSAGSTGQLTTVEIPALPTAETVLANQDARR